MDDEIYATHTHIARVRVMKTAAGTYRGIVHLREVGAEPESDDPHETEMEFSHEVQGRNAPRALANKLLKELEP
ncbi:hypothetical protein V4C53_40820 [Paraburkholderia azotifigens]|uniref:hypothetical protein n=1 Tax=Paraburkholderia azotifigens TaxID=2057004 RepID=UPI00317E8180